MEGFATTFVLVGVILSVCEGAPTVHTLPGTNALFIGTVDGKSYLADDTLRNWTDSKAYCVSVGMRLASVKNDIQRDFIDGINNSQFQNLYWTAGRDALSNQQFSWNHDNQPVNENLTFYYNPGIFTCVGYNSKIDLKAYFSRPCTDGYGALCEST